GRQLVEERRRAAGAESRLAAAAAERAGDVRALALLEQDHEDQEDADDDVDADQGDVHGASSTKRRGSVRASRGAVKRARPPRSTRNRPRGGWRPRAGTRPRTP